MTNGNGESKLITYARQSGLVMVADPDVESVAVITYALAKSGFRILTASGGLEVLAGVRREQPNLAVIECELPDLPGISVAKRLREDPSTAQVGIVLMAPNPDPDTRVTALETGADDFIAKPFAHEELVIRVRNVMARREGGVNGATTDTQVGDLIIDRANPWVSIHGERVALTPTEYRLILALADRAGKVMSRAELMERVWHVSPDESSRTVDIHVRRLRAKLGEYADVIESVRGFGYRLSAR